MPKESNYKWKLGLFAVMALVIAVTAIYFIGKQKNKFGSVLHINALFKSVSGLKIGSNVRFGGIDIGTVDDIGFVSDTTVQVQMIIQNKVQKFIKKDAIASIGSEGLMGDKVITITPGTTGQEPVTEGSTLGSRPAIETEAIMASLKTSADNAAIITSNLADISTRITKGRGALGKLLNDTTMASNISSTMKNLKKSTEGLNENMEAAKHNFLFRGYFKKKEKEKQKKAEEAQKQGEQEQKDADKSKESQKKDPKKKGDQ
jgi:phospholipid/cholesterol/gamma-HCH transport system substrate-binding protein